MFEIHKELEVSHLMQFHCRFLANKKILINYCYLTHTTSYRNVNIRRCFGDIDFLQFVSFFLIFGSNRCKREKNVSLLIHQYW